MAGNKKTVTKTVEAAKSKYPEVKDIQNNIKEIGGKTAELAQHVKQDGVHQVEEISARVGEKAENLKAAGQRELEKVELKVRANPMQSVAIAFAGGLLASLFLRGRR